MLVSRGRLAIAQDFKGKVLNMLSWPGHGDAGMVGPFEEKYGVKVKVKEYVGGDQLLASPLINRLELLGLLAGFHELIGRLLGFGVQLGDGLLDDTLAFRHHLPR